MKNIYVLPTDKPSRLYSYYGMLEDLSYGKTFTIANEEVAKINLHKDLKEYQENLIKVNWKAENIYITSDEKVTQNGIWAKCSFTGDILKNRNGQYAYKVILTTDNLLIKDGVQAIDDDFLEWFVENPNCEEVEVREIEVEDYVGFAGHTSYPTFHKEYKIIIPKEEHKEERVCNCGLKESEHNVRHPFIPRQETLNLDKLESQLDDALEKETKDSLTNWLDGKRNEQKKLEEAAENYTIDFATMSAFKLGAKWQAERMYSEDDVLEIINSFEKLCYQYQSNRDWFPSKKSEWFEQFKKK